MQPRQNQLNPALMRDQNARSYSFQKIMLQSRMAETFDHNLNVTDQVTCYNWFAEFAIPYLIPCLVSTGLKNPHRPAATSRYSVSDPAK